MTSISTLEQDMSNIYTECISLIFERLSSIVSLSHADPASSMYIRSNSSNYSAMMIHDV